MKHGKYKFDQPLVDRWREVPHDCDDPECPGNVNRQRLEAFEDMREALESWRAFDDHFATSSYCEYCDSHADKNEDGVPIEQVRHDVDCPIILTRAALAKAKGAEG